MGLRELPRHLRVDAATSSRQLRLFDARLRTFAPYDQWEDYRAGMFLERVDDGAVRECRRLLSDHEQCEAAMQRVVRKWPVASAVNLTNNGCNRRAWLGQAACCLACGATAVATKRAWWQMTDAARTVANKIADEVIDSWTHHSAAA
jgi:hypothetical protein